MPWVESVKSRGRASRTYYDEDAGVGCCCAAVTGLHYEPVPGSGVFEEVDYGLARRVDGQLDGWVVDASEWRYALGQPGDKSTDGWVGFGGRGGAHWLRFRLGQVGYLHWPTRGWQDVGGSADYDRVNLEYEVRTIGLGPNDEQVNAGGVVSWRDVWTTPGGGSLSVSWRLGARGLKEEVVVNQAAREWIRANAPPSTPAGETWFGFVFGYV